MVAGKSLVKIQSELREGMELDKCKKCECMKETLESLFAALSFLNTEHASELRKKIENWLKQIEPSKYACLGCEYCFPAVVLNLFNQIFPEVALLDSPNCAFEERGQVWPPVPGEYFNLRDGENKSVAVSTLSSIGLAEHLASIRPEGLCIVGKTETENIGIDKLIKNTITNPAIHFLLITGKDPKGHHSGRTILALLEMGIDENMRVKGSPGKRPILRNVTRNEVEAFRKQVKVVDFIGCEDVTKITKKIEELSRGLSSSSCCEECTEEIMSTKISNVPVIHAEKHEKTDMDKTGYFVIIPQPEKEIITVEYYSYDNRLRGIVEGKDANSIYMTIIENKWVSQLSHAAYLGKELSKAELSIKFGFKFVQDDTNRREHVT